MDKLIAGVGRTCSQQGTGNHASLFARTLQCSVEAIERYLEESGYGKKGRSV